MPGLPGLPGARIRVLVVDDSVVIRRLVKDVLDADPDIEVVGTAVNGRASLTKVDQLAPDVITMDIEMPEMDGISAVRALRAAGRRQPIIMFSTLSERGAVATLDALDAGASDYVAKPANMGSVSQSIAQVRDQLIPKVKALAGAGRAPRPVVPAPAGRPVTRTPLRTAPTAAPFAARPAPAATAPTAPTAPTGQAAGPRAAVQLLAVGCSTGGPTALETLLRGLPGTLRVPVVVVQHMPPVFTAQLAARLDRNCAVHVVEATSGQPLQPGTVYVAPGDHHLEVRRAGAGLQTHLQQGPAENFCRPAVDVLFRSVAAAVGPAALGLVMTGMGSDGRRGSDDLVRGGARVVVQDAATSVVWGMPGSVAQAGLADAVLPLTELAPEVLRRLGVAAARPDAALAGGVR
ncbi:protein-glutamate methylesterase/protein-glutamine glutaminase [Angustibacter aerolatus]